MELGGWVCAGLRHSGSLRRSNGAGVSLQAAFQNEHPARPASFLLWPPAMACKKPFSLALLPSSRACSTLLQGASFLRHTSDHTIPEWILQWLPTGIRTKSELLIVACRTLRLSLPLASPALYSSNTALQPHRHSCSSANTPSPSSSACSGAGLFLCFRTLLALTSQSCSPPPLGLKVNACPPTLGRPSLITLK